ncbi:hypothetical protein [Fructobacillus tropaeoli]|jgi:hypothetical protein|uniref:hypothetical protein n=1 Tax=Fructobacillus tropaeoli TaxID=709323 RepID=UPI0019409865|nr:hypothetical protein [Fructobacillus tropaeoli]GIC70976.1 hypothetical protein FT12353_16640 [Fructobacillus tropaeoli]
MRNKLNRNKKLLWGILLLAFLLKQTISFSKVISWFLFLVQVVMVLLMFYADFGEEKRSHEDSQN